MSQVVGGRYTTHGTFRSSRVGSWFVLSDQDGQLRGGLRLNALDQAETQRLQGVLSTAPGLLNVVDQVQDESGHWLVTALPATPTVAEALQARIALPPALTLLIAVDTGQALAALHDAGMAHGGLSADTVVLSADGRVLLAECGYAHALASTQPGPGHDTTAWVKLLRGLATPRPADDAKRLLNAAADEAEALGGKDGLNAALISLSNQAIHVAGYGERSGLAMLASMVPTPASAAPPPKRLEDNETVAFTPKGANPQAPNPQTPNPQTPNVAGPNAQKSNPQPPNVAGPSVAVASVPVPSAPVASAPVASAAGPSVPGPNVAGPNVAGPSVPGPNVAGPNPQTPNVPGADAQAQTAILRDPAREQETLQPAQLAAQMNQRKEDVLRFGRGVAPLPQPQRRPPLADTGWAGDLPQHRPNPRKPWRARIIGILGGLVTLVLVAYVGYQMIQRLVPLRVSGATVALAEPLNDKCDVQAKVIGTIRTNGAAGTITYRWLTSDGKTTAILAEQVNLGTDHVQVPLLWTFSGRSTIRAKATLHILTPSELEASTEFTYSCK